ncbi:hypothetical protein EV356DRAFT_390947 [Viridothelium virens]|uniref:Heterokaryon incompatibility domain-containing protein n=1 Tax=Viridothelium virens TaxID=1048519 RepID=A0A6A6GUL3_VIRVR|nr:hypothetical protein EV356DRAFT_390947 [Viridothelium virens]
MDHLFMPDGACSRVEDDVCYQGSKDYLKHTFHGFAESKGYSFLFNSPLASTDGIENYESLTAPDSLNAFLQEWLFFGFLKEVFDNVPRELLEGSMFEHDAFIRSNPSWPSMIIQNSPAAREEIDDKFQRVEARRCVLYTKELVGLAKKWVKGIKSKLHEAASEYEQLPASQYEHLAKCISTISRTLQYLSMRTPSIQYDSKTTAVIAATTEFVVTMITKTFENTKIKGLTPIIQSLWNSFGWRDIYVERMVNLGWCRHAAARINFTFPALQVIHFCTNLRRYEALDHSQCTKELCQASANPIIPRHRSTCKHPRVDYDGFAIEGDLRQKMLRIIRVNGLPLLKIRNRGDKIEIKLAHGKEDDKYIALSHVWSDGMGNHSKNSLPWCQLESLHSRLAKIPRQRPGAEGNELLVWIDTLCCPVEAASQEDERARVMGQMRQIYEKADFVFVLDSELESINRPLSKLETAFRILTSNWMRRLWTLQEGYLARELWVQFKNEAFELDQDDIKRMNLDDVSIESFWIARTVKALYASLRRRLMQENIDSQVESTLLAMALQGRSVTKPSDEPLCIATLLNLDAGQIAAFSTEGDDCVNKRMSMLWTLMQRSTIGIPKSVLFYTGQKLRLDGFHWAPASLLDKAALPLVRTLFTSSSASSTTISPSGLCVQSEGILLPPKCSPLRCLKKHRKLGSTSILNDSVIYLRDNADRWFIFYRHQSSGQSLGPGQKQPHTSDRTEATGYKRAAGRKVVRYGVMFRDNLVDRLPASPPSGECLLVAVHGSEGQAQLVTALETIMTNRAMPEQAAIWEIAYQTTVAIRMSEDFKTVERRDALRNATADLNPSQFHMNEIPNAKIQTKRKLAMLSSLKGTYRL